MANQNVRGRAGVERIGTETTRKDACSRVGDAGSKPGLKPPTTGAGLMVGLEGRSSRIFISENVACLHASYFSDLIFMIFKEMPLLSFTRFFDITTCLSHHSPSFRQVS